MITELNRFMMLLLKEKERATMMEDIVSHTLVKSTCTDTDPIVFMLDHSRHHLVTHV